MVTTPTTCFVIKHLDIVILIKTTLIFVGSILLVIGRRYLSMLLLTTAWTKLETFKMFDYGHDIQNMLNQVP